MFKMAEKVEKSEAIIKYFTSLDESMQKVLEIAKKARMKNFDPEDRVDIPLAKNMAERVQGLISIVAPQIVNCGMTKKIHELEKEFGLSDWRVGFIIAELVARQTFCKFKDEVEAMEVGIRVGISYLTGGIVSAPLEGFIELKLKNRLDGKKYFSICYAGPIRGAGGTAAAVSVLVADFVRVKMGYEKYDPTEEEINRYVTELIDYHERVTNLQYFPSEEEIKFMVKNLPVEINGDPTEKIEVSNYKGLARVETNKIRGGVCLVIGEGLCQKAKKMWPKIGKWGHEIGLVDWDYLKDFLDLQDKIKAKKSTPKSGTTNEEEKPKVSPNYTYIKDLVAGRPIITHPMVNGGLRLRYGRTPYTGHSTSGIHPSTQILLNNFIATGTQLKVERPGKGTTVTPCDNLEPPLVKLKDGTVRFVSDFEESKKLLNEVEEILFLGDILFCYGDFVENGHKLVPAGYCEEWWVQELEKATVNMFGSYDLEKLANYLEINEGFLKRIVNEPIKRKISSEQAII
ncbi:DNA polymerase II large subunit, partial [Nanoarchaeota archaeon]